MQKIFLGTCLSSPAVSRTSTSLNNKIPTETLVEIFKCLDESSVLQLPLDILNASLTCTHWQAAAELVIKQNMFNDPLANMECADLGQFLNILRLSAELGINYRSRVQYITLNLKNCFLVDDWNIKAEEAYISICKLCDHARGIHIPKQKVRHPMLRGIRTPEQMIRASVKYDTLRQNLVMKMLDYTLIREFQYEEIKTKEISKLTNHIFLGRLRSLTLTQRESEISSIQDDTFLQALCREAKDLRYLRLHMCRSITGTGITSGDIYWPKLRYLLLSRCDKLTWKFVFAVVMACPKLYEVHYPHLATINLNEFDDCPFLKVITLLQKHGFQPCDANRELWHREDKDKKDEAQQG
ncbi:hypothetical protein BC937DRAFT_94275 [Endogone sp. FLAS-F59071]|nr:hypothetical protein BC937DRAFT_94275 [Endogone sp. FLAS-F59071]|eukprot:RUS14142.1 hypothetical protein BC937DRAFT_94275 [Endogone sp. FLAS-F59071]